MRKIIAALQISVDGFIEGPNGELDWVDTWEDPFNLSHQIDACILGAGMYPGYEHYWRAILANPGGILPFTGRAATPGEVDTRTLPTRHRTSSYRRRSSQWTGRSRGLFTASTRSG